MKMELFIGILSLKTSFCHTELESYAISAGQLPVMEEDRPTVVLSTMLPLRFCKENNMMKQLISGV